MSVRVATWMGRASAAAAWMAVVSLGATAHAQTIAIVGAKVYPVSGPAIDNGTVVVRDGKIAAVGAGLAAPAGAQVVDAHGKVVTPGFLDSASRVGEVEIDAYEDTTEYSTEDPGITAAFDVVDGLNPLSSLVPVTRVEGVTRVIAAPQPGKSIFAGKAALLQLGSEDPDPRSMVVRDPVAMFVVLGSRGGELSGGGSRSAATLRLREDLLDARDFAKNRKAWENAQHRSYELTARDLEALQPVVRGELPLAVSVNRASDIVATLRLAQELGIKLMLVGAADGWMVADRIAAAHVPVIVDPMTNIPDFDSLGATLENGARLMRAGVDVLFASFDAHNSRDLRQAVGNAISYGAPWDAALRAVTLAPARVWGVADRYGSIEVGKDADLVLWSGDPFELLTRAEAVWIRGRRVPEDTRQRELLERYRNLSSPMPAMYRALERAPGH